jgi:molybdenum cofactor cytidylyltransferase
MQVVALLLAAGASSRFGTEKLLVPYRGRPLFEHALEALLAVPEVGTTIVVVRPGFSVPPERPGCRFVVNPDHREGMSSSLRVGVRAAPLDAEAYLIALADMPEVRPSLISSLIAFHRESGKPIVFPVCDGRRGHPVVIGRGLREALLATTGDVGAREIIRTNPELVAPFETADRGAVFDIDVPGDLRSDG